MEKVQSSSKDRDKVALLGLFSSGVALVLYHTLKDGFSIPSAIAACLAIIITLLSSYPIFVRGTKNQWTKDKREWTFSRWLIIGVLLSILMFILFWMIDTIFWSIRLERIKNNPF